MLLVILIRISLTFYETPRAALGPELTKEYDRRTFVTGWSYVMGVMGAIILSYLMYEFFLIETEEFQKDMAFLNPISYTYLGISSAIMILIFGLTSCLSTHKFIPELHKPTSTQNFSLKRLLNELLECFNEIAEVGPNNLMIQDLSWVDNGMSDENIMLLFKNIIKFKGLKIEVLNSGPKYSRILEAANHQLHQ